MAAPIRRQKGRNGRRGVPWLGRKALLGLLDTRYLNIRSQALGRLLNVAQGHSGQCEYIANFLLGLYNGRRFKFDLSDFRCLDRKLFQDCMAVLRMDYAPQQEVHCYFESLAKDWNITDYTKIFKQESV